MLNESFNLLYRVLLLEQPDEHDAHVITLTSQTRSENLSEREVVAILLLKRISQTLITNDSFK